MATDYFSENEAFVANQPLPSPSDTPYASLSRRTSRYGTPSNEVAGSPAPFPPDPKDGAEQTNDDDNILLDPRRFTPTLHASLVSEILNLRRELDSKHKYVEDLETNLHNVRNENDTLTSQLSTSSKENRAVKRQLQQLENGTLSALEEIAGERDKTKEANADLKERLEATQKKLRGQEDDSTRVHDMWAHEKEVWAGEKRILERRVHVSESRLKLLLDELAMQEAALEEAGMDSENEDMARDSALGHESDSVSVQSSPQRRPSTRLARHSRNLSNGSYRSIGRGYRMSLMSGTGSEGHGRLNGLSLADELVFDEEEEDLGELELDSDDYPENEMRARRALESRQSMYPDEKAKRILGLSMEAQQANQGALPPVNEFEAPKTNGTTARSSRTVTPHEIQLIFPPPKAQYVDTGVQPSPPPSPVRPESAASVESSTPAKPNDRIPSIFEVEANQSRKRVSAPTSSTSSLAQQLQNNATPCVMTSTSSQTVEQPLSPPATPKIVIPDSQSPVSPVFKPEVTSVSTQTEPIEDPAARPSHPKRAPPPVPLPIPSIAIHAPTSAPPSPKEPILPPGTKSISTQTTSDMVSNMRSVAMQTEPIRIDKRPIKLPPHLLPSAIRSKPGTPEPGQERPTATNVSRKDSHQPVSETQEKAKNVSAPSARQDLIALLEKAADKKVEDRYPGNNDNGPLARDNALSRPFRTSSLFAGFDGPSSDEEDHDAELSDEEIGRPQYATATPMLSSRNLKNGRVFNNPPTPVPEDKEVISTSRQSEDSMTSSRMSMERPSKVGKPLRNSLSRQPSIRRSAMIQNGTAAHMRSRSPSIGSIASSQLVQKPPFPVPTRSSSRKVPLSKSEGSQSPTPRSSGAFAGRRPYGMRQHQRKDSLRKVRSAAVIQKSGRSRSRSPPLPATPVMPPSPSLPPLPSDMIAGYKFGHRPQLSTNTSHTATGSVGSAGYQASVVDAIAATMVGEWMWKYVRKRKTFGGPESPADIRAGEEAAIMTGNGVRHKRWVWISPYERSVLWSSKQPTTSSALIGKSGRKLTIQSVLDVADNNSVPKGIFNRSILILTPARALKFTTVSRERHYLWLTALSFLAHSSSPIPEIGPMPPAPPPVEEVAHKPSHATLRRSHVRDSVRLAKDKANPVTSRYTSRAEPMPDLYGGAPQLARPVPDAADPPTIPRGPYHGRKRSSTGPGAPPPSVPYRSFSHQHVPSIYSSGSSDMYNMPPSVPSSVYNPQSVITSGRTSEASTSTRQHFFDAMGTVRMEAFIDNSLNNQASGTARPRMGRRRGNSQWSGSTDPHRAGGIYEDFLHESSDPFRGF